MYEDEQIKCCTPDANLRRNSEMVGLKRRNKEQCRDTVGACDVPSSLGLGNKVWRT